MCLAVPGRVLSIDPESVLRPGRVDFAGISKQVSLACVPEVRVGDYVLVHAGIAITRVDEQLAAETLDLLRQMQQQQASEDTQL